MDAWQVQDTFWNQFGIPAYDNTTVKPDAVMPYITYEAVDGEFGVPRLITASIWYRAKNWRDISQKSNQIKRMIKQLPPSEPMEGGRYKVRIPEDMPWAQRMSDEDEDVRRIVINVEIEFMTGG